MKDILQAETVNNFTMILILLYHYKEVRLHKQLDAGIGNAFKMMVSYITKKNTTIRLPMSAWNQRQCRCY